MTVPVVSVVIPTYNHARFLKGALQSVVQQTFRDWEAIVVNNYSEDETEQIVAGFDDSRIRLVNFRNHGIIAAARNHGIGLARGQLIAFLDSDDLWYPGKLQHCIDRIDGAADAVCHGEVWVHEGAGRRNVLYGPRARTTYMSLLYEGNALSTSAVVVRKSLLDQVGGFSEDPKMVTAEDYELWIRLARARCRFAVTDRILGEYLLHSGNHSKAVMRHFHAVLAVLERHFAEIPEPGPIAKMRMRRRIALAYYAAARAMQAEGRQKDGLKLLLDSWRKFPFIPKLYAACGIGVIRWLGSKAG
jgi:glycosyltransferase involved in cell wall biosynthesis